MRGPLVAGGFSVVIGLALLCSVARSAFAQQRSVVSALAQGHAYRHGVVPMLGGGSNGAAPALGRRSASTAAGTGGNLLYNGGTGGVGVVTGAPRVYLVFWGSQWGSQGTDSNGDVTLSGDSLGMAPRLQEFMKGVGTNGETWSRVVTQYCQGVSLNAQTCPTGAAHVAYPSGGVLAGVWVDESSAAPFQANGHDIGLEAVNAATHFANTDQAANASTQYVIVSPTGVHPDGFNTSSASAQFCAWHDFTGDSSLSGGSVSSPYGQLAFTNLPYITDAGAPCGKDYVNSGAAGTLDGVTIVEGHEYAETLTDPYPSTGWVDTSGSENADKCAWIAPGKSGGAQNITLSTGSFAVQSTWANDDNGGAGGCEISRPNIGN